MKNVKLCSINKISIFLKHLVLICIFVATNTFAIAISDNDGAAFITKAEFDSLKNSFQAQINQYNSLIDNKIDSAIAQYIAGVTVEKKFEQISLINQLSSIHFTKDFNYFGKITNVGDYLKYWSWYYFAFGLDATAKGSGSEYGVGLRGGTNITEPVEKESGTSKSNYIICGQSSYDNTKYIPSYGVETYNYYYLMCLASYYGANGPKGPYTGSTTFTGHEGTKTEFGINFYSAGNITVNSYSQTVSAAFSAYPMDTVWTTYDANALPGNVMSSTAKCQYIKNNEIITLGSSDGTFDSTNSRENLYWVNGSGRQTGSGTVTLNITKYKRKYQEQKYVDFINDTISQIVNGYAYYYNGMPIFKASESGQVSLKIKPTNSSGQSTYVAILDEPFANQAVGSGGIGVPDAQCDFTNWNMISGQEYEIKFNVKKGVTYWLKACPSGYNSKTSFSTSSIIVTKKDN